MYADRNKFSSDFRRRFVSGGMPATWTIIGLTTAVWFLFAVTRSDNLVFALSFTSGYWPLPYPWTAVTWPLMDGSHPIYLLFALLWAFNIGGSLERSWGSRVFTIFFCATNAMTAFTLYLGGLLLHIPVHLSGLWTGLAAVTVAWCLINQREKVCLGMVLPIPAIWIAYLTAVIVWWETGSNSDNMGLGLFALSGCVAAYWYVADGRTGNQIFSSGGKYLRSSATTNPRRSEDSLKSFNLKRWLRDRAERRRLEELFRRSGFDDRDKR